MTKTETRQRLIEAGTKAMLAKSYHAVGLQEVLTEVGVPKGSFYHYFKSKEDFGVAVIEHYAGEHGKQLQEALVDRSLSPRERLWVFFQKYRDFHSSCNCHEICLIAKLGTEVSDLSCSIQTALKQSSDQCLGQFARCIREGQETGEFDASHDPEMLAEFLHSAWEGAMLRMKITQSMKPLDNFITLVFERLLINL